MVTTPYRQFGIAVEEGQNMTFAKLLAASALALVSTAATAKSQSGSANGLTWTATNTIVAGTSTGTVATGGNPEFLARNTDSMPGTGGTKNYSGTVGIIMTYSSGAQFVCSGTLLSDRASVATAGHCVSDGAANDVNGRAAGLVNTKVVFLTNAASLADIPYYAAQPGGGVGPNVGTVGVDVSRYIVNQNYTGEVIDQNDIAILRLAGAAPAFAQSYGIYTLGDLTGSQFNVASFGTRSTTGGALGTTNPDGTPQGAGANRRREGDNVYDYALGNGIFGGFFTDTDSNGDRFFGKADVEFSYLSDFDNGLAANDASCLLAVDFAGAGGLPYCSTGLGLREVSIAGGDSGGGAFINGALASINSYGLSFGADYGDFRPGLQSSWGEYNGFVPTYIHQNFINAAMGVPEPAQWALMISGFALVGGALRRRNTRVSFA